MLSGTRKTLAIITIFLVIIVTAPALFVYPVEKILFNPVPYEKALTIQDFYQRLPAWLAQITSNSASTTGGVYENALSLLGQSGLERVYTLVLSPGWVQSQTESLIEQSLAYLNFETGTFTLRVNLLDLKTAIGTSGPTSIAGQMIRSWPPCTAENLAKLAKKILNNMIDPKSQSNDIPLCRPPEDFLPFMDAVMGVAFTQFANIIPDQIDLVDLVKASPGFSEQQANLTRYFAIYRVIRWVMRLLPVLAAGLFLLLGLLTMQSWRTILTYNGIGMLVAGFLAFFITILVWLAGSSIAERLIQQLTISASDQMIGVFIKLLIQVGNRFTTLSVEISGLCFGIGVIAIASPMIFKWLSLIQIKNQ
ncbi:MAG: hypothetical protein IMZ61_04115 [Planctomycetes bacterium]|nr:hypothetical protein [Planctomycetota bacterium]